MGVPSMIAGEMYQRLERIERLAKEVEAIPNFGPDVWTMRDGDKKCQQIWDDAKWLESQIRTYIGSGDGGPGGTGWSSGTGGTGGPPRW